MSEHEDPRRADELEDEVEEMQERAERLEGEIDSTREDWERKQRDPKVPGAGGDPDRAEENPPESDYPSKR